MATKRIPFSEARQNLASIVDEVERSGRAIIILRRGKVIFGVLPFKALNSIEDFKRTLGKPVSIVSRPNANPYYRETDTVYTLVYTGFQVIVYEITHEKKIAILQVQLTENRLKLPLELKIGSTRREVQHALGNATTNTNSEWTYICSDCVLENKIIFRFSGEKVRTIEWDFELD
jgi:antitoxin (DNA-binding transcriptional repressor) of toxin-antitoxin stability system